ncbi:MAG: hypothetical protein HC800_17525 [Phormidesmis sp. RL_2_1]|nr:hypothetical protein [Phormidesmis sp. RL_2_1]
MTSQKDQIKSLIVDIERVLSAQQSRKPWIRASDVEPQRQALARAQNYLKSLQQSFEAPGGWGPVDPSTGQISSIARPFSSPATGKQAVTSDLASSAQAKATAASNSAENVLQALLTEMKFLKSSALEPLRLEMDGLRSERNSLQQEVQALAEERQAILLARQEALSTAELEATQARGHKAEIDEARINQLLMALMERLQENLSAQVTQTLSQLESDHAEAIAKLSASVDAERLALHSQFTQQLSTQADSQNEELRQLQSRSDQLLVNIDTTLQRMFETLQQNIDTYHLSLNEGIDTMYSLGRQGEAIVRSLVDHLTQQLGQTAPPEPAFSHHGQPARQRPYLL